MARRKHSDEINVGSDSFLDVIANIVGILIILIVIAGIRVSRAPAVPSAVAVESPASAEPAAPELAAAPPPVEYAPQEPDEPEFVEQTEAPAELTQKLQAIQRDVESLETVVRTREAERGDLDQRQARGELQITAGRTTLLKEKTAHETRARTVDEMRTLIDSQKSNLNLLQTQLLELEKRAPSTKTIKHRVTPLSRTVVGEQIHFRISNNRISQVPIHDLLQAAMRQAKRHAESLLTKRSHMGTVGPISGYLLQYKLEAIPATSFDTAKMGPGMVRIALTSFQLQPDADLPEETVEEALTRGSMFDLAVQTAEPGSTFTLWVYPDSFPTYRKLQNRLHDADFTVAGRPLPHGIPIAGSPDGSASAGQ